METDAALWYTEGKLREGYLCLFSFIYCSLPPFLQLGKKEIADE